MTRVCKATRESRSGPCKVAVDEFACLQGGSEMLVKLRIMGPLEDRRVNSGRAPGRGEVCAEHGVQLRH